MQAFVFWGDEMTIESYSGVRNKCGLEDFAVRHLLCMNALFEINLTFR